jgi:hypothetical protein
MVAIAGLVFLGTAIGKRHPSWTGTVRGRIRQNLPAAELTLTAEEMSRLEEVSAPPLLYLYWWQAKYDGRLGDADLALLGRYQAIVAPDGLHRPQPGFDVIPGAVTPDPEEG